MLHIHVSLNSFIEPSDKLQSQWDFCVERKIKTTYASFYFAAPLSVLSFSWLCSAASSAPAESQGFEFGYWSPKHWAGSQFRGRNARHLWTTRPHIPPQQTFAWKSSFVGSSEFKEGQYAPGTRFIQVYVV
jgi:hypothetical protein